MITSLAISISFTVLFLHQLYQKLFPQCLINGHGLVKQSHLKRRIFYYIVFFFSNDNDIYLIKQMYMGMEQLHHIQFSGRKTAR